MQSLAPDTQSIETYSIKVQTIAANKLADAAGVPSTLDKFYVGMKFIPMEADKTGAGGYFGEVAQIPAQGGPAFPLLPDYMDKEVVWASSDPGYWRGKLNQAREGGIIYKGKDGKMKFLVAPYSMKDDSHTSNASIIAAKFSELERYITEGRLSEEQERAIAAMLNDAATRARKTAEAKRDVHKAVLAEEGALDLLKKIKIDASQEMEETEDDDTEEKPKVKKKKKGEDASQDRIDAAIKGYKKHAIVMSQMDGILKFPKTFTAAQINAFRNQLNFPQRKWIADKLSSAAAEKLGVPPMDQVRRATLDPSTPGVSEMSIFSLLEIDVERLEAGLKNGTLKASDFGVPAHGSYDTFAPGKPIVHFRTPVPYPLAMPTLKAELESQNRTNHPY
jgi:phenylpyruvate tautomerase PptA (4-oxalocrotonate tautomerase family)